MKQINGYNYTQVYGHLRATRCFYVKIADLVAEQALGKYLPLGSIVHHVDSNRLNDTPSNLVICQNEAYHQVLERRTRAFRACEHVDWRKCNFCKEYDNPKNLYIYGYFIVHRLCAAQRARELRESRLQARQQISLALRI